MKMLLLFFVLCGLSSLNSCIVVVGSSAPRSVMKKREEQAAASKASPASVPESLSSTCEAGEDDDKSCEWSGQQSQQQQRQSNTISTNKRRKGMQQRKQHEEQKECTLVMAPSTIPNAGLGIFTLVDLQPDTIIGEIDLVIPMKELMIIQATPPTFKDNDTKKKNSKQTHQKTITIFDDYVWSGRVYGGQHSAYTPGLQSLSNSHLGLYNVFPIPSKKDTEIDHSDSLRLISLSSHSSSADDSTIYHNLRTTVGAYPIPAGHEIFAFYGDHWFQARSYSKKVEQQSSSDFTSATKYMAISEDYEDAEHLATIFQMKFGHSHHQQENRNNNNHDEECKDYWPIDLWQTVSDLIEVWNGQVAASILPAYTDVQQVSQLGIRSIYQSHVTVDVDELKTTTTTTSRCVDSIRPGLSKIHNYGAFAKRQYRKGDIITGSPIMHSQISLWDAKRRVWNNTSKSFVDTMADDHDDDTSIGTTQSQVFVSNQNDNDNENDGKYYTMYENHALLINYCWSHVKSSILLCPYAPGVSYLNHASTRNSNTDDNKNKEPNVKIQWVPNGQISHNDAAFEYTPKELYQHFTTKVILAMDFVALTDIYPGQELTIDYGAEWEKAHDYFLKHKHSIDSWEGILKHYNSQPQLRTESEQVEEPYPNTMELKCHPSILVSSTLPTDGDDDKLWQQPKQSSSSLQPYLLDCSILERQQVKLSDGSTRIVYTVRVLQDGQWRGRSGIPRRYIRWFAPSNHQYSKGVFRFPMQLPDDMVPEAWMDLI